MSYADDCSLWFEIPDLAYIDRGAFIDQVNAVLLRVSDWGVENHTAFEPSKMTMMVVSNRKVKFDPTGVVFEGTVVKQVDHTKIVGFTFDSKLTWSRMIDGLAKKGGARVAALRRMAPFLDSNNLKLIYTSFIRPVYQYGHTLYVSAADSHLAKLDRVQANAVRIGDFEVEPLSNRRHAAIVAYAFKLLDGKAPSMLHKFKPNLISVAKSRTCPGGLSVNTLTSMQYFYSIFGPMSVDRLPGTVKGPFKTIRYYLGG